MKDWGPWHASSPPAETRETGNLLHSEILTAAYKQTYCDPCYEQNKQRAITEVNAGEGSLWMGMSEANLSEDMT